MKAAFWNVVTNLRIVLLCIVISQVLDIAIVLSMA
jgi:hypothetical protein